MREIKVRCWDKKLNIMWEGIELTKLLRYLIFQQFPNAEAYIELKDHFGEIVWLQFTGLLDRNGKEIWEGDLIKNNTSRICEVTWCKREGAWDAEVVKATGYADGFLPEKWKYCIEVIGNIYEHSDLLK
jgi:uncharacterized phage protein (TIGR01671 family)